MYVAHMLFILVIMERRAELSRSLFQRITQWISKAQRLHSGVYVPHAQMLSFLAVASHVHLCA
jgi:hypothetical protein